MGPPGFEPGTNQLCIPPRFSPPPLCGVCGLDYPFAPPKCVPGRLPSSLYTFPVSGLGSGLPHLTAGVSPNLAGFTWRLRTRWPFDLEPAALTAELGTHRAGDEIRTRDILLGRQALYR